MINGAHIVLYSRDAEADRGFLRETLGLDWVDAGGGWPIFALPPSEVAVHPAETGGTHELFLMCDDLAETTAKLEAAGIACEPPSEQPWGLLTRLALPGGSQLGLYEPRHPRP
ncbi:MAG: extradiol dioxygenase [Sphingomonadaceae bacterium]|nr:extradiol dioxygenase [Sphingomonadaceae bacterium]